MFRKILVPLDGSPFAERAIALAEAFAQAQDADVGLVRVVPDMGPGEREPGLVSYLDEHRIKTAREYLDRAASRLRLGRPVPVEARLAEDAVTGVLDRAREMQADLILMTSHGESWPDVNHIGGTAARLIREAPCPILVVGLQAGEVAAKAVAESTKSGMD